MNYRMPMVFDGGCPTGFNNQPEGFAHEHVNVNGTLIKLNRDYTLMVTSMIKSLVNG